MAEYTAHLVLYRPYTQTITVEASDEDEAISQIEELISPDNWHPASAIDDCEWELDYLDEPDDPEEE